jgi:choline dehydrogenase-like flavoprotein
LTEPVDPAGDESLIGIPHKQFPDRRAFDAIVIGSGIGGIGTTALLAKVAGRRVLVVPEKHYTAGGFTHVFHRPWDVGVHHVGQIHTAGSQAHALFEHLAEGRLSWHTMPDVYDRVTIDRSRSCQVPSSPTRDVCGLANTTPLPTTDVKNGTHVLHTCHRRDRRIVLRLLCCVTQEALA